MELVFNTWGNEKQKQVYRYWADAETSDIVYGGSKGSGKSYLGCSLIFGDALLYPGTAYFIARKKLNDLRRFTIPSIHEVLHNFGLHEAYYRFNGQDNVFILRNGSKVFLLDAKYQPADPHYYRFGSMQITRGMIEEAGEFAEAAKNNLAASIGRWKNDEFRLMGKLIQTCNPAKNYLYKDYYKAHREGRLPAWRKFVQAYPEDNKRLAAGYLEHLSRTLNTHERERLLKGNWEYDDDPATLIPYENIINCFSNTHVQPTGRRYITADIARFGADSSVIVVWDGWKALRLKRVLKSRITEVVVEISELKTMYGVPTSQVICDEDGVGGGAVDMLGCRGFVANSRPVINKDARTRDSKDLHLPGMDAPENFDNLKSQCYFKLADEINQHRVDLTALGDYADEIIEELEQVKQKAVDSDLKKGIIPKDAVKEAIGRSPDFADALMMRKWFDLFPEYKNPLSRLTGPPRPEWNSPISGML